MGRGKGGEGEEERFEQRRLSSEDFALVQQLLDHDRQSGRFELTSLVDGIGLRFREDIGQRGGFLWRRRYKGGGLLALDYDEALATSPKLNTKKIK